MNPLKQIRHTEFVDLTPFFQLSIQCFDLLDIIGCNSIRKLVYIASDAISNLNLLQLFAPMMIVVHLHLHRLIPEIIG